MKLRRDGRMTSPRIFSTISSTIVAATMAATVLLASTAFATAAPARGDEASARAALLARFEAALHADLPALERLFADDLEYCGVSATCSTKSQ
jgi:hypothetical protein